MGSGAKVALCIDSIFGVDVDAIGWDYGLADNMEMWKALLYAYHTGMFLNCFCFLLLHLF